MNIARDACGIRTASSPRVKLMSSFAFNPRFFSVEESFFEKKFCFFIYKRMMKNVKIFKKKVKYLPFAKKNSWLTAVAVS